VPKEEEEEEEEVYLNFSQPAVVIFTRARKGQIRNSYSISVMYKRIYSR